MRIENATDPATKRGTIYIEEHTWGRRLEQGRCFACLPVYLETISGRIAAAPHDWRFPYER
ncbi:MAG: hypothetical protein QOH93_601 [Chloroflexia bacterium]|jgi:hypothetical protein|nr:hypothetical protein [Chloroflexia bacterium]